MPHFAIGQLNEERKVRNQHILIVASAFAVLSHPAFAQEVGAGLDEMQKMLTAEISRSASAAEWDHFWEIATKSALWVTVVAVAALTAWITRASAAATSDASNGFQLAKAALAGATALVAVLGGISAAGLDFAKRKETWQIRENHLQTCLYAIKNPARKGENFDAAIEKIKDWGDSIVADRNVSCAPKA
ncbi:hypothetical protein [Variovorax arabinosiphilus]|uniref:hypothetical protein n=1 Tax=Variovorax arabinosiphilus TaxID=3053498 RepID=UPI002574F7C0|nr:MULTISPECIES: hypothetical protein [unclassified Variovorax]MDM0122583.1 hypothetical protein [Variovorax sp. J2L1-78]MDM0130888.1 hypothetical protein [Variovorax sp. J2L1-63]MDM0235346.1 hypothetical protein [Variovorax sp. J2R1-6]